MFIKDFTADVSTLNFGTDKDTKVVHETLHAKGIVTISELCHLSKKNIEAFELDPALIELHLKKNGLSFGMSDNDILQHQEIVFEMIKTNCSMTSMNKSAANSKAKEIISSFYKLDADWSERYFELAKNIFLSDHCIFRSTEEKMERALILANKFIVHYFSMGAKMVESLIEK